MALWMFRTASLPSRFLAALGAAFFLQATSPGTKRNQQLTMLCTGAASMLGVFATSMLARHILLQELLIIAISFLAFYVRRFLPDRAMFPIFGFVLSLLGTIFPGGWPRAAFDALAVGAGLLIAFVIGFVLFPQRPLFAFTAALAQFFTQGARLLCALQELVRPGRTEPAADASRRVCAERKRLQLILDASQRIVDSLPPKDEVSLVAQKLLILEYGALHSLALLGDETMALCGLGEDDAAAWRKPLVAGLRDRRDAFATLYADARARAQEQTPLCPSIAAPPQSDPFAAVLPYLPHSLHPTGVLLLTALLSLHHLAQLQHMLGASMPALRLCRSSP
jgi:hypothetical protein